MPTTNPATLSGSTVVRNPGATVLFRGTALGTSNSGAVANIKFATAPSEVGTGSLGTTSAPIMPWALGDTSATGTGFATSNAYPGTSGFDGGFVTYDPTVGVRLLKSSEYAQPIDGVPYTSAQLTGQNVFLHGGAYTINKTTETWNSVLMPANGGFFNNAANPGTLTVTSGAISIGDGNYSMGVTTLDFGNAEGIISIGVNDLAMTRGGVNTVISGSGGLTKTGPNKLTIAAANTYSGTTTIASGTLLASNTAIGSATGSGNVIVAGGATLGGTGTAAGNVTVNSGATVSPGNGFGILTAGPTDFSSGGKLLIQVKGYTAGTSYDRLNLGNNTLTLDGSSALTLDLSGLASTGTATGIVLYGLPVGSV